MTYGATTTVDSHPLARTLAADAAHLTLVREEYERTKDDHEFEDGCDNEHCAVGANPDRLAGWEFVAGQFLCGRCAFEAKKRALATKKLVCDHGHEMAGDNLFRRILGSGAISYACRQCRNDRSRNAKARKRAAKRAA